MPHAALWVVQPKGRSAEDEDDQCFNAARGFVGGAAKGAISCLIVFSVSMPHAALWVVQPRRSQLFSP